MFRSIPVVTKNLIIINVLFWVASLALPKIGIDLVQLLGLYYPASANFYPFQFVTYMFVHDTNSFQHIFFNMFALFMFGRVLEDVWGSKRFLIFYIVTGIGAGIIQELVCYVRIQEFLRQMPFNDLEFVQKEGAAVLRQGMNYTDPLFGEYNALINSVVIGASGAIFGILLAFGMLFPDTPLFLMFIPVPIKAKYFVIGYSVIELVLGISNTGDNIAHLAHLGGMLFGFFMILYWRKKDKKKDDE